MRRWVRNIEVSKCAIRHREILRWVSPASQPAEVVKVLEHRGPFKVASICEHYGKIGELERGQKRNLPMLQFQYGEAP